jgi:hypothetical protein
MSGGVGCGPLCACPPGQDPMTTYVLVQEPEPHRPDEAERSHIDRFVAAFLAKKALPPAGTWRVPGVGYCVFLKILPAHFSE